MVKQNKKESFLNYKQLKKQLAKGKKPYIHKGLKHNQTNLLSLRMFVPRKQRPFTYQDKPVDSPIGIIHRDDNKGGGSYYDHLTIQTLTNSCTYALCKNDSVLAKNTAESYKSQEVITRKLPKGYPEMQEKPSNNYGALFIPGFSPSSKIGNRQAAFKDRNQHSYNAIRYALLRGQPILAVCGGMWELAYAYHKQSKFANKNQANKDTDTHDCRDFEKLLIEANGHSYRGGMPRITASGRVGHNKDIHTVQLKKNTLLRAAMQPNKHSSLPQTIPVNSVHRYALNREYLRQTNLKVSALATRSQDLEAANFCPPAPDHAEAIEPSDDYISAPVLGIQWHPEAYVDNHTDDHARYHSQLIQYMNLAGSAYIKKCRMLNELMQTWGNNFNSINFLRVTNYLTELQNNVTHSSLHTPETISMDSQIKHNSAITNFQSRTNNPHNLFEHKRSNNPQLLKTQLGESCAQELLFYQAEKKLKKQAGQENNKSKQQNLAAKGL